MSDVANKYVVWAEERLRDGRDEWAQVVTGVGAAVALANSWSSGVNRHNVTVLIFRLGEHVPLVEKTTEVPQPSVTTTVYELAPTHGGSR